MADIPPKRNRKDPICFSPHLYRARNLVERVFNRIKRALVQLASIRLGYAFMSSRTSQ